MERKMRFLPLNPLISFLFFVLFLSALPLMAEERKAGEKLVLNDAGIEYVFRWCPPGEFTMGSSFEEWYESRYPYPFNEPRHQVRLTRGFWLLETPVTVRMYRKFAEETGHDSGKGLNGLGGFGWRDGKIVQSEDIDWTNPGFPQTDDHPAVCVTWEDAVSFCRWLSERLKRTVTLPTEAQWEYAARAGTETVFFFGDDPEEMVHYGNVIDGTFREKAGLPPSPGIPEFRDGFFFTSPVRSFKPNPWGLYDLYGNVFESCLDWYGEYPTESVTDPVGPSVGQYRTNRGGSWDFLIRSARSGARGWDAPNVIDAALGFRPCLPE